MVKTFSFPNAARNEKDDRSEGIYFTWIFNEIRDSNNRMREASPIHRRGKNLSPTPHQADSKRHVRKNAYLCGSKKKKT
jgi:hypothetical protein